MDNTYEKVEKFHGLTFVNIYKKEKNEVTIKCFKRDMLNILKAIKVEEREKVSA